MWLRALFQIVLGMFPVSNYDRFQARTPFPANRVRTWRGGGRGGRKCSCRAKDPTSSEKVEKLQLFGDWGHSTKNEPVEEG